MVGIQNLPTSPEERNSPFNLVGETVRYLLSAAPHPNDRKHQIRLIWGNGLNLDIWEKFQVCILCCTVGDCLKLLCAFFLTFGVLGTLRNPRSGRVFRKHRGGIYDRCTLPKRL